MRRARLWLPPMFDFFPALLDDLDRELNNFAMRLKEWYGWHFPELSKIVTDNLVYARAVKLIGFRSSAKSAELESLLPDEVCAKDTRLARAKGRLFFSGKVQNFFAPEVFAQIAADVRMSAETSMGTEMTEEDLLHINCLACRVEELVEYRANLAEYLKVRMKAVAPNLTHMVRQTCSQTLRRGFRHWRRRQGKASP